ncbi:tRNA (adenine(58)-N(1))-methyltransferase non-catalytic subunit TRM6-like [Centruroides sculpturatus]|uniref:tRNA (adenine(58)-N(1))-methyltransferase non-catalytic subunit TRM6-like n=1 Tax=Centruroides sculpturatus TaxID=218467 RepID=UPI000C6E3A43|nr:tRNA (adenine(58)-N(1))-methyltransferase non-catalytic subunit TRM6-like [Centruroides sculpturatus]
MACDIHMVSEEEINKQIKEKDYVIVKKENYSRLIQIAKRKPVYVGKQKLYLDGVIGHPYNSTFEIRGGDLIKSEQKSKSEFLTLEDNELRDNRNLIDDQTSQKLTKDEIETFKAEGLSGEKIIENLIENSSTFKEKTHYAQAKYLKKKQQKYLNYVKILKPTTRLLAEMYYEQGPMKICNLRIDSLSQMLNMCNVRHGGKYIVVDSVFGLMVAAVLERLGSEGSIIQLYLEPGPVSSYRQAVNALNIPSEILEKLLFGLRLNEAMNENLNPVEWIETEVKESCEKNTNIPMEDNRTESFEKEYLIKEKEKMIRRNKRQEEQKKAKAILKENKMDGLLIACKHHPKNMLLKLLEFLSPSSPFAVFCNYQTPLVECYSELKEKGNAILMNLTESWLRNYQVLPERTHPDVSISGSGGYLLTGIKIIPTT